MRYLFFIPIFSLLGACASSQTAKQFRMISYEQDPSIQQSSVGTIEGRDCSWSVLGYSLGDPTARSAFINASQQKREGFVPGQTGETKGEALKSLKNVSVEEDGFYAWVVGRRCIIVAGEGFR